MSVALRSSLGAAEMWTSVAGNIGDKIAGSDPTRCQCDRDRVELGGPCGDRTHDLRIKSQLLNDSTAVHTKLHPTMDLTPKSATKPKFY